MRRRMLVNALNFFHARVAVKFFLWKYTNILVVASFDACTSCGYFPHTPHLLKEML